MIKCFWGVGAISMSIVMGFVLSSMAHPSSNESDPPLIAIQDQDQDQDLDKIKSAARKEFMLGKLDSNRQIMKGLATRDFDSIRAGSNAVVTVVKGQHWFVLDTPEYKQHSKNMSAAASKLKQAAGDSNIEAAALRYFELTMTCIDCHEYIAGTKY